jgi:rhamnosyltransferase subunit B
VDHVLTFAGPLVAESLRIPRVSTTLQPFAMFSAHDPPVAPAAPWLSALRGLGPLPWRALWALGRMASRSWFREVDTMRAEMALPARRAHPMFDGASHDLHLALFSRELAPPQPDWPVGTVQPGFPIHDRGEKGEGLPGALAAFLDRGEPPLVFTLGSSAVYTAEGFYIAAAEAARALGQRAVLLTGLDGLNPVPGVPAVEAAAPDAPVVTVAYAPHSEVMPRACATVHQGGVGTTAQAMLAGRPMLVVPFSHDQPDNAARCERIGIARTLKRSRLSGPAMARELKLLLADAPAAAKARAVAERMHREPGAAGAADAIEALLAR